MKRTYRLRPRGESNLRAQDIHGVQFTYWDGSDGVILEEQVAEGVWIEIQIDLPTNNTPTTIVTEKPSSLWVVEMDDWNNETISISSDIRKVTRIEHEKPIFYGIDGVRLLQTINACNIKAFIPRMPRRMTVTHPDGLMKIIPKVIEVKNSGRSVHFYYPGGNWCCNIVNIKKIEIDEEGK